jgi:hypothetical protein
MATAAAALGSGGSGSTGRLVGGSSGGDPLAAALTPAQRWYLRALHLELQLWDILACSCGLGVESVVDNIKLLYGPAMASPGFSDGGGSYSRFFGNL